MKGKYSQDLLFGNFLGYSIFYKSGQAVVFIACKGFLILFKSIGKCFDAYLDRPAGFIGINIVQSEVRGVAAAQYFVYDIA